MPNKNSKSEEKINIKKHQHIYLLHLLGLKNETVMKLANCNAGELCNVRKAYRENPCLRSTVADLVA